MAGKGGKTPGAGRKKGVPNKITTDMRKAIVAAFDGVGGVEYLISLAKTQPASFCTLLGKTVPVQMGSDPNNPIRVTVTVDGPPNETRDEWIARRKRELGNGAAMGAAAGAANGRHHG